MNEAEIRRIVQNTISSLKADRSKMTLALAEKLAVECGAKLQRENAEYRQHNAGENCGGVAEVIGFGDVGGHPCGNTVAQ